MSEWIIEAAVLLRHPHTAKGGMTKPSREESIINNRSKAVREGEKKP